MIDLHLYGSTPAPLTYTINRVATESVQLMRRCIADGDRHREVMASQYPHLNPDEFDSEHYSPARRALVEGREGDAVQSVHSRG